nr:ribonuclease H [Tanacetum cinerariifolium]
SQGVKRSGPTLEPGSPKKMKSTAGPSLRSTPADQVPTDTGVSTAVSVPADQRVSTDKSVPADQRVSADKSVPADTRIPAGPCESSSIRRSTRKKSVAQKRTTPPSSIPFSTDDPDATHTVDITFTCDDSDEDDTPHPIITGVHLLGWQVVPFGLGTIHTLFCHGGIRKTFTTLRETLHRVDRQTLIRLYVFVDALSQKQPLDGIALSLWGDLKIMLDTLEVNFSSPFWQDQHKWGVRSWKLYNFPGVYGLELKDGTVLYMLVDREYPLEIDVMEQLLDHKLQIEKDPVGNTITIAIQLIKRIKGYLKEANRIIFCIMLHGGYFEYWKAGLVVVEHVENGVIELYFVNTEYQLADLFTKALGRALGRDIIEFLINKLGMRSFTPETLKQLTDEVEE